jgi:hypothetical protein
MGKTFALVVALVVVGVAATAGTARAGQALHVSFPVSDDSIFPAGTLGLCDFTLEESFTGTVTFTQTSTGTYVEQESIYASHTNLDTGYTLTEHTVTTTVIRAGSSTAIVAGVFWHLTTSSGQKVLVKAGVLRVDLATGEISFTPNSGFDQSFSDIVCPALGGTPA